MTATTEQQSIWLELLGAETRYYNAGGIRTRAIESGSGDPPLIMLHGVGGHAEAFARNVVPLGRHFRTIALDYLGHGLTGSIDGRLTKEAYTKHLVDFMDAAGIEKANLLGESLGGWISVMTSLLYPERVNKIVYCVGARLDVPVDEAAAKRTAFGRSELQRLTKQFNADPSRENVRERLKWLFHKPDTRTVSDDQTPHARALDRPQPLGRRRRSRIGDELSPQRRAENHARQRPLAAMGTPRGIRRNHPRISATSLTVAQRRTVFFLCHPRQARDDCYLDRVPALGGDEVGYVVLEPGDEAHHALRDFDAAGREGVVDPRRHLGVLTP